MQKPEKKPKFDFEEIQRRMKEERSKRLKLEEFFRKLGKDAEKE